MVDCIINRPVTFVKYFQGSICKTSQVAKPACIIDNKNL
jgi:hypothetical protein